MAEKDKQNKATPTLQKGDTLGKYEVQEVLGVGGQSVVYKGYDPLLDRHVAIKQLAPHLTQDETYLSRMRENVRAIAKLGARNEAIVTILDVIEESRGMFYVMEFIEGHTLQTVLNESGPTEPKAVLLILFRLAGALHDVHAAGIVHRDLKPSNIIIAEGLRPKIIDFGVAALHGGDISMPLATTKYLAPEVYTAERVDGRADIYSLGFIAYEMLLGREAFNEIFCDVVRDEHSAALRWMKWHGNESVEAPPLHEVDPSIPLSLSHLVARMIEKNPENRFQNTEELGRAMKQSFSTKAGKAKSGPASRAAAGTAAGASQALYEEEFSDLGESATASAAPARRAGDEDEGPATAPLPLDGDGPATAPLPKGPMTRRTKIRLLAAGGVFLVLLIAAGVGLMIRRNQQAQALRQQADTLYGQATASYEDARYAEALKTFQTVNQRFTQTSYGRRAKVMADLSEIWLAIEAREWDDAQLRENEAAESIKALSRNTDNEKLEDWARQRQDELEQLRQTRLSAQNFYLAIAAAETALANAIRESDYDDALRKLQDDLQSASITTTAQQDQLADDLTDRIRRERAIWRFNSYLDEGQQQSDLDNFAAAEQAYNRALALLGGGDPDVKLIEADQRDRMQAQAQKQLKDLSQRRLVLTKRRDLQQAEQSGDPLAIRQALQALLDEPELPDQDRQAYQARLTQLQVQAGLKRAEDALAAGRTSEAETALKAVLDVDPDNAQASGMLADIEQAAQRQSLIREGDSLLTKRDYQAALQKYSQAARLGGADTDLRAKIRECNYSLTLAKANAAREAGNYVEAERLYEQAATIKPDAKLVIDAQVDDMRVERAFDSAKAKADALLREDKWDEAIKLLKDARDALPPNKVTRRQTAEKAIAFALYRKYVSLGDQAAATDDLPTAQWYYGLARKQMDTPEIRRKLQAVGG